MEEYSIETLTKRMKEFLEELDYESRISEIADIYPEKKSLYIDWREIDTFDSDLADYVLEHPYDVISAGELAVMELVPPSEKFIEKINLRIVNLPVEKDVKVEIRDIRSKHVGKFLRVEGLVRRATEVRPRITDALFECLRCHHIIKEKQEGMHLREPLECYKDQGGCGRARGTTQFKTLTEKSQLIDTQKIELQEMPEELKGGAQPQRISGWAEDDITGKINVGDRVALNGILRTIIRDERQKSTKLEIFLDINSFEIKEKEYEEIEISEKDMAEILKLGKSKDVFRKITASISPTIYGMLIEKEALALQLFGGVAKRMPDGTKVRGDIHILFVGDPGTAKSQLLRYISDLAPRGIYAAGRSSSAAGLTASAVKDESFGEGRWVLEAGALVLADMGVACVDELDKMTPQDRSSMHEVMEQQTVSVAKAGITATLQARCAILGAANPKFGRFDENRYLSEQIELPPTLLSRFDVIFPIIDRPKTSEDSLMADHIIRGHLVGERMKAIGESVEDEETKEFRKSMEPELNPDFLRKYIAYAKQRLFPVMGREAMDVIKEVYMKIRKRGEPAGTSVPITPRQLEAMIRLAEASARARLSDEVIREDAERAIRIVEEYLRKAAGEAGGGFDIDIIATGKSRSQWDAVRTIIDIIRTLSKGERPAEHEDIIGEAKAVGIDEARAETILKRLKDEGEIYRKGEKKYMLVNE